MKLKAFALRAAVAVVVVSAACAVTIACSDHEMTVGSGPIEPDAAPPSKPTTVWSGYTTGPHFLSGSDRVTLTFTSPTSGTVVFGDPSVTVPPVTDHTAAYPPGCPLAPLYRSLNFTASNTVACTEHFPFTMTDVTEEPDRLRLTIDLNELWGPWCKAQTRIVYNVHDLHGPVPEGLDPITSQRYVCAPADGTDGAWFPAPDGGLPPGYFPPDGGPPGSPDAKIDDSLEDQCVNHCSCTTSACDRGFPLQLAFDLHVSGGEATGSTEIGTVYLKAQ
jgi:hypothetical protein